MNPPEWLYHGTSVMLLGSIAEWGLEPSRNRGRMWRRMRLSYFTTRLTQANGFAGIRSMYDCDATYGSLMHFHPFHPRSLPAIIRVRSADIPRLRKDWLGMFTYYEAFSWVTPDTIPPEKIEVLVFDRWMPLREALR